MPLFPESKLPRILLEKPETMEVIETFERLFQRIDSSLLPARAKIMPYTDEAESVYLRDNTPPWEETGLPSEKNVTYGEIFDDERGEFLKLETKLCERIVSAFDREVFIAFEKFLPARMRSYAEWILGDLTDILQKRLLSGRQPSLFEDLFQVYRAGYFSYGWTGEWPDEVRFLVFPASERNSPAPPARHEPSAVSAKPDTVHDNAISPPGMRPHNYYFAQIQARGGWDGQCAIRLPLHDWIGELKAIPDTMHMRLRESRSGFDEEFVINGSEPLNFRWKQTASASGLATITIASELFCASAILSGLNKEEDQKTIEAMDALLAKDHKPSTRPLGLTNRPLVVSAMFKNAPNGERNSRLLTFGFADIYFWMIGAYRSSVQSPPVKS